MALLTRKGLCETLSCLKEFRRFRGKVNVRKPRTPHFQKALYLEFTKPWFLSQKKGKTITELCEGPVKVKKQEEENAFQRIIANELYDWFKSSRLIIFYHHNSAKAESEFKALAAFRKENMHYKNYGKKTMEMALKGTPYEAVLDFYNSQNMTLFSPLPEIKKVLKISKKFSQLVIMAAIFEGKFISKDDLLKYSEIPNLQTAQASLVHTLRGVAMQLSSNLTTHQQVLVSHLDQRLKQLNEDK